MPKDLRTILKAAAIAAVAAGLFAVTAQASPKNTDAPANDIHPGLLEAVGNDNGNTNANPNDGDGGLHGIAAGTPGKGGVDPADGGSPGLGQDDQIDGIHGGMTEWRDSVGVP